MFKIQNMESCCNKQSNITLSGTGLCANESHFRNKNLRMKIKTSYCENEFAFSYARFLNFKALVLYGEAHTIERKVRCTNIANSFIIFI